MKLKKRSILIIAVMVIMTVVGCSSQSTHTSLVPSNETVAVSTTELTSVESMADKQNTSKRFKKITISSVALQKEMRVNVYLPKEYSQNKKYPVLYLIHGYTGNEDSWFPDLQVERKADKLIENKEIEPLIIVSPQIDNSYGINSEVFSIENGIAPSHFDKGMYEDYLYKELIPYIDANYSTIASKEGRYIGGLSMGGWVALHMAFTYTDMFSKVGGHSPAIFIDQYPGSAMAFLYPTEKLRNERDPIRVAESKDLTSLKVFLDCGDNDSYQFYEGCEQLNEILKSKGVDSQYHLSAGEHDGAYWEANVEKYLKFYAGK
ncbi:esterase [Ruminiclostridium herbifermentans]|uniref:Esterase n=1 Tax=Ruminiclostridium herbifermentans TaxID=2488810 RepID=A0A4U7JB55_9FIRM|nr:alpha/beta hydrolase-fold protein [Ruminiclostridium herbifermentans]QNU68094.1 esterase [Ruminiclostridium herbifermentans]